MPPLLDQKTSLLGISLSLAAAGAVLGVASLGHGQAIRAHDGLVCILVAGLLALALARWMRYRPPRDFVLLLLALLGALAIGNLLTDGVALEAYGDEDTLAAVIATDFAFPRWLGGATVMGWLHALLFPGQLSKPAGEQMPLLVMFLGCVGAVIMFVAAAVCLRRFRTNLAAPFAVTTPLWLVFSSGYSEYYPFIAGFYVWLLLWVAQAPLGTRDPRVAGLIAGLSCVAYVGFAPTAALLLLALTMASFHKGVTATVVASASYFVGVKLCWGDAPKEFFATLYRSMLTPEVYEAYRGLGVMPMRAYFVSDYALSTLHARELAYEISFGLTLPLLLLAMVAGVGAIRAIERDRIIAALREPRAWFFGLLFVFMLRHFVFAIPKLGPRNDIDFFWMFYVLVAMLTGTRFAAEPRDARSFLALCVAIAAGFTGAYVLLVVGLPPPPTS